MGRPGDTRAVTGISSHLYPSVSPTGPMSHPHRILLVRDDRWQASERLFCPEQNTSVFRYCMYADSISRLFAWIIALCLGRAEKQNR